MLQKSPKKVPRLRFPEFEREWEIKQLGFITDVRDGTHDSPKFFDRGKALITSKNLLKNGKLDLSNVSYISEEDFKNINRRSCVDVGDILFGMIGTIGNPVRVESNDFAIKNVALIKESGKLCNSFLIHYLASPSISRQFFQKNVGGTQKFIALGVIRDLDVGTPVKIEQEKIAGFLTAVDSKIAALQKKKELLEKYKKGIMQAIFSQKIRFNDENRESFPDWKEKKLGDIGEIRTGKTPSTLNKSLWDGDILFVTPTDMVEGVKYQVTAARTVNASNGRVLPAKTIMYTCIASIGKMALSTKPTITNQQINSLILTGEFDKEFVYYTLLWMTPKIQATQANNTLPIINKTDFSKFKIPTPSINEQQKIVDFLSAIDEKIELTERKLEQAKKFKKALLQQMFV